MTASVGSTVILPAILGAIIFFGYLSGLIIATVATRSERHRPSPK